MPHWSFKYDPDGNEFEDPHAEDSILELDQIEGLRVLQIRLEHLLGPLRLCSKSRWSGDHAHFVEMTFWCLKRLVNRPSMEDIIVQTHVDCPGVEMSSRVRAMGMYSCGVEGPVRPEAGVYALKDVLFPVDLILWYWDFIFKILGFDGVYVTSLHTPLSHIELAHQRERATQAYNCVCRLLREDDMGLSSIRLCHHR